MYKRQVLILVLALVATGAPAMADCGIAARRVSGNGYGGDADDYGGCSVEISDAWYDIKISSGQISGKRLCTKFPAPGYCGCSDYGIF